MAIQPQPRSVILNPRNTMELALATLPPVAAIGYSILYLLFGGGIFGAIVIYIIAKMLRH